MEEMDVMDHLFALNVEVVVPAVIPAVIAANAPQLNHQLNHQVKSLPHQRNSASFVQEVLNS